MRSTLLAALVCALTLPGAAAVATADPAPVPLITLTTIPAGWQERTDLRPELRIFADGKAIKSPDAISADRKKETEPKKVEGTVPADVISAAGDEVRALRELDFGVPTGEGKGSRLIDLMPADLAGEAHVVVYSPEVTDGLTPDQQAARKRFTDLYRKLVDAFTEKR
ncbi:hypothetical protein [Nocardia thailandica]